MWDRLTSRVEIRRKTALLVEPTAAAQTMSLLRALVRESLVEARVWGGSTNTGEVSIQGLVAGVMTTETLVFVGASYKPTTQRFSSLLGVTTSALADEAVIPSVQLRAIGGDGSPQETLYSIRTGWPAAIAPDSERWANHVANGRSEQGNAEMILAYDETWRPRSGDLVIDDVGQNWEIVGKPRVPSAQGDSLWQCRLQRVEEAL